MPLPLLGAALIDAVIVLLSLAGFLMLSTKMTGFELIVGIVFASLPVAGLILMSMRKPAARRFHMWFVGFWAFFAGIVNLGAGLQGDLPRLVIGLVALAFTVPVVWGLKSNESVRQWLSSRSEETRRLADR